MKKISFILFAVCFILTSCNNDESDQEVDYEKLDKMHNELIIASLSNSETCTNPEEWNFTGIGSKSCGGYAKYIVYSKKINIEDFLAKVKTYTDAQNAYNKKWGIISDCSIAIIPTSVECIDEKPKLSYGSTPTALK